MKVLPSKSNNKHHGNQLLPPPQNIPRTVSLLNLEIKEKGDYIFQAAAQISLGQQCEAAANYHMAFNYFRTGIGILLTGVQCKH
jgi:hypothetical protein